MSSNHIPLKGSRVQPPQHPENAALNAMRCGKCGRLTQYASQRATGQVQTRTQVLKRKINFFREPGQKDSLGVRLLEAANRDGRTLINQRHGLCTVLHSEASQILGDVGTNAGTNG